MTNEVLELIEAVQRTAESCCDSAGCIQDNVDLLIDEDCDLTPNERAALDEIVFHLSRASVEIDEMWSKLAAILRQNNCFQEDEDGEDEEDDDE